jgi:transposase
VRAMAADGFSQREIALRLGINRRTVSRMLASDEPPRYRHAPRGSMLDPLQPVLRRLLVEWPAIRAPRITEILRSDYGYEGSVDLVRRRLQQLRPTRERPAQRTGYRPGQVLQLDWGSCPRARRSPAASGASTRWWARCLTPGRSRLTSRST